jgi:mono/diheme cytochrome c family protein
MRRLLVGGILMMSLLAFGPTHDKIKVNAESSLIDVQESLGMDFSAKKPNLKVKGVDAAIGEDIVKNGFSKRDGKKKARRQSKYFVCTSCHNISREDPNLALTTPEARLTYTSERGLPFLQATTLYGAVNRETYYNGDYEKKYGDLVAPARNDIRGAIQLCAQECAQGRKLKDWEVESVLAYLWKIDLKLNDLVISEGEITSISEAIDIPALHQEGLKLLSSKYSKKSEATFLPPPKDRKVGVGLVGNPANGKLLYNNSCLHCHYQKRYSFLPLDNRKMTLHYLDRKADTYNRHSIYQVARYGTYALYGKRSYMPNYTKERMSEQQLADLRAYLSRGEKES